MANGAIALGKRLLNVAGLISIASLVTADEPRIAPVHGASEVTHDRVEVIGGFWGQRLKTHCAVTVPHALDCLERGGHMTNFDMAAGTFDGPLRGHHAFDSDLHKALEGAMYSLQHRANATLLRRVDGIVDRVLAEGS